MAPSSEIVAFLANRQGFRQERANILRTQPDVIEVPLRRVSRLILRQSMQSRQVAGGHAQHGPTGDRIAEIAWRVQPLPDPDIGRRTVTSRPGIERPLQQRQRTFCLQRVPARQRDAVRGEGVNALMTDTGSRPPLHVPLHGDGTKEPADRIVGYL